MHISKLTYKTNVQLRPFQHEHVEVTVDVAKGESPNEAFDFAKSFVRRQLGIDVEECDVAQAEETLAAAKKAGLR